MPTIQATNDFNHAIDAGYYVDGFFSPGAGNPAAVGTPLYHSQPQSLKIVTGSGNSGVRHNLTGAPTRGWCGFAFQSDLAGTVDCNVCGFQSAALDVGRLAIGTSGLYLYTSTAPVGASLAISAATWYWIEMIFDVSGANHQMYGRVNGVDLGTPGAHAAGSSSNVSFHQLIGLAGDSSVTTNYYGVWYYGSAANNTDWLGEPSAGGRLGGAAALGF